MTYEELVSACKELRARWSRARAEFFLFLMNAEQEHEDVWRAAGIESFEGFLSCHSLCKPELYRLFVIGVERQGKDNALDYGADWTIQQAHIRDPSAETLGEMDVRAKAFTQVNQVAPSSQTVERWRRELDDPQEKHSTVRKAEEIHRLRAQVAKLTAELKSERKAVRRLERELGKTPKQVPASSSVSWR